MDWWSAPWWAGVQGVTSLVGAAAISIAVIEFFARLNNEPIDAMNFKVRVDGEMLRDERETHLDVTVSARPMGNHVLYEPEWRVWGLDAWTDVELPAVLDVRSDPVEIQLRVPRDRMRDVQVGVQWIVPRRLGPYAGAARVTQLRDGGYERWITYRWRFWPRKGVGHWVRSPETSKRDVLRILD